METRLQCDLPPGSYTQLPPLVHRKIDTDQQTPNRQDHIRDVSDDATGTPPTNAY